MSIAEKFEVIADAVYEKGKKTQYDEFWDALQNNGKARNYAYAFYGAFWNDTTYNPKHNIVVTGSGSSMFTNSNVTDTLVDIDFSGYSGGNTAQVFSSAKKLETVRKLIMRETHSYTNSFASCSSLKNITFGGVIGRSISFADSPLTVESMKNIIEHLKDYSGTDPEYTLTLHSSCWTRLAEEGNTAPNGKDWRTYAEEKGWLTE